jgi:hypothetical protein
MFFLVDEEVSFPITFPAEFQAGVSMNEAVRQPIELLWTPKHRYWLPFFFQQTSTPTFSPDADAVQAPTSFRLFSTGRRSIDVRIS